ncbi:MAG: ROK family protein [Cyclobacteriaceae bacterium]
MSIWGIDLGGTKIEGVILKSAKQPEVLLRKRIPTEADQGYEHIVSQIAKLIDLMSEEVGYKPEKIGIGTPGTTDPASGLMKNSNTVVLNGTPFRENLEKALGIPVKMANDANCFALAETLMGSVKNQLPGAKVVFGVIMGSGVGGGLVINGHIIEGRHGIGGEWGHNFLDESGGKCYCGQSGCVETIISGKSLERYYFEQSGKHKKLKDIYADHLSGSDPLSTTVVQRLLTFFGKGLSSIINAIDPDAVVLGGGVGNIDLLYTEGAQQLEKYIFNHKLETKILKPELGDSAGVFGAAMLVEE